MDNCDICAKRQPPERPRRSLQVLALSPALMLALLLFLSAPTHVMAQTPPRCDWSDQVYVNFYAPPDLGVLSAERLGELLRVEHIQSYTARQVADAAGIEFSAYGAEAYRVLYLSQAPSGIPRAVSGLMVVPAGPKPQGGFPVISDGHGTSGLADVCAPSKSVGTITALLSWVPSGYIVSATDYVGLGTPGLSPYAVGKAEAFSLLDGARAALDFCDSAHGFAAPVAANRIFIEGQSQGGHAALFAQQEWQKYAAEVHILGTVTFAPGSEPRYLAKLTADGVLPLTGPMALALYSYSQYYGYPTSLALALKQPYATETSWRVDSQCLLGLSLWFGFGPDRVFQPALLQAIREERWDDLQPWTGYMDVNTPGNFSSPAPVLILQGEADDLVPPEASQALTQRLCAHGTPVELRLYPNKGHLLAKATRADALKWMAGQQAGKPIISSCSTMRAVYVPLVANAR